ncbi:hypothetical protein ACQQ68_10970 [Corynebacterium diphtheriae]
MKIKELPHLRSKISSQYHVVDPALASQIDEMALWWITEDMCTLAAGAAESLPEWSPTQAMPTPSGFMWIDGESPAVKSIITSEVAPIRAIGWTYNHDKDSITAVTWYEEGSELTEGLMFVFQASQIMTRRSKFEKMTPIPTRDGDEFTAVQFLGSIWLLSQQPGVAEEKTVNKSSRRNRSSGGKTQSPSAVRVINVRGGGHTGGHASDSTGGSGERHLSVRFMVRGHWRQQACGPKHGQRKPLFIQPFMKGPDDAPVRPTVRKL